MIATVTDQGVSCWSDGYRSAGYRGLVYLSLFGNRNAVRAIWARMLTDRGMGPQMGPDDYVSGCQKGVKYVSLQTMLSHQIQHLVIVHPEATQQLSPFAKSFYVASETPETDFFGRLNRLCSVPFRPEWAPILFERGLAAEPYALIYPLKGFGIPAYQVDASPDGWRDLVVAAAKEGVLR